MPLDWSPRSHMRRAAYHAQIVYPAKTGARIARYYTVGQVCVQLQVGAGTVLKWLKEGKLKGSRLSEGGNWRIKAKDVEAFLRSNGGCIRR